PSLGYCWPFQGPRTKVLIRLPAAVEPRGITLQHTSNTGPLLGTASSAPRDFTVSVSLCWALGAGTWPRGKAPALSLRPRVTLLFAVVSLQNERSRAFRFFKLGVQSTQGNQGYICIYQVQVHGKMVGTNANGRRRA
ncbi:SUN5 protein, partial [Chionis minor]|nr:SUN5 protein [Chionis minor]